MTFRTTGQTFGALGAWNRIGPSIHYVLMLLCLLHHLDTALIEMTATNLESGRHLATTITL